MAEATRLAETESVIGRKEERDRTSLREYAEALLGTVILALFGTSFVVQAFKIPSQSMEQTLLVGDHLLVTKLRFGGSGGGYAYLVPSLPIRRGGIVWCKCLGA